MRFALFVVAVALVSSCSPGSPPIDGGSDSAREGDAGCRADGDCDDGLFCNGAERCDGGLCVAGRAPLCSDGVACTIDTCSEDARACRSAAPDRDRDGAGDVRCTDGTGVPLGGDCADDDPDRFPGNTELCDPSGHDEDCDDTTRGASDADGDGALDARCCNGSHCGDDCNDARASVHPGASDVCNLIDDDCDTHVDEGVTTAAFVDADRDGYGDPTMPVTTCGARAGFAVDGTDCDDTSAARNPGQVELCDLVDNDCDAVIDEAAVAVAWYADADGDGFGDATSATMSCAPIAGRALRGTDCDDGRASVNPAQPELCNGRDDDCDGAADFVVSSGDLEDDDGDGVADAACGGPDCDDLDAYGAPGQPETCNGRDDDCDARVDEGAASNVFYRDADGDGFGGASMSVGCTQPPGLVRRGGDCDDASSSRRPGAPELCDAIDQDCDGAVDEAPAQLSCTVAHASAICASGACEIGACDVGFADCASTVPGCESDLRSDRDHCGRCASACAADSACTAGRCGPRLAAAGVFGDAAGGSVVVRDVASVPGTDDTIAVGRFTMSLTLGATVLVSAGGSDAFAAVVHGDGSFDSLGRQGSAEDGDEMAAVAIDPATQRVYVGGRFCGVQTICGSTVGAAGTCRGFFRPLDCAYSVVLDTGVVISSLAFERTASGTAVLVGGSVLGPAPSLGIGTATADYDGFIARFVESPAGTLQWAHRAASNYLDQLDDLALDGAGHVVGVGFANGPVNLGSGLLGHAGGYDSYLMTLDTSTGALVAGRFFGSGGYDVANALVVDGVTAYVVGTFQGTVVAGESAPPTITSSGASDGYIASIGVTTGAIHWMRRYGGAGDDGFFVAALVNGNVAAGGTFQASADLGGATLTAFAGYDAWVVTATPTGDFSWARAGGGAGTEVTRGLSQRASGSVLWWSTFDGASFAVPGATVGARAPADVAVVALDL